jgi:hypothetical protein
MGPLVATFIRAPVTSRIELSVHASGTKSYDYSISKEFVTQAQRLTRLTSAPSSIGRSPRGARLPLIVDNRCCCCMGPVLVSRKCDMYGDLCADDTSVPRSSAIRSRLLNVSAGRFTPAVVASEAAEALIAWRRVDMGWSDEGAGLRASLVSPYDLISEQALHDS